VEVIPTVVLSNLVSKRLIVVEVVLAIELRGCRLRRWRREEEERLNVSPWELASNRMVQGIDLRCDS